MIRYSCPNCKQSLTAQDNEAGNKLHCPCCNQRLQIPARRTEKAAGTVLGKLDEQGRGTVLGKVEDLDSRTVLGKPEPETDDGAYEPKPPPSRRNSSREVIHVEPLPETDEDDRDERPSRRRKRSKWSCPYCDGDSPFRVRRTLTVLSWVLLILFIWTFPFCLLALLITEEGEYCSDCGQKVGSRGTSFGPPG